MTSLQRTITLILGLIIITVAPLMGTASRELVFQHFKLTSANYGGVEQPLLQDSIGFVWLRSSHGLYRYDGTHFELMYSLPDSLQGLFQISNQDPVSLGSNYQLWIKLFNTKTKSISLSKYDPIKNHQSFHSLPIGTNKVYWANTDQCWLEGWYPKDENKLGPHQLKLYDGKLKRVLESHEVPARDGNHYNRVFELLVDSTESVLWMASDVGLMQLNLFDGKFSIRSPKEMPPAWTFRACDDIDYDDGGEIWLDFAFGPYLYQFDPENKEFEAIHSKITDYSFDDVTQLVNQGDSLWIVDGHDKLLLLDKTTWKITSVLSKEDPVNYLGKINNIFVDRFQNIWVGGSKGVVKINSKEVKFSTIQIPNFNAQYKNNSHARNMVFSNDGALWVASQEDIIRFDPSDLTHSDNLANWPTGCGYRDRTKGSPFKREVSSITGIARDRADNVWVSGWRCIQKINPTNLERSNYQPFTQAKKESLYPLFRSMTFDSLGFIWGGGMDLGIGRVDPDTGEEFLISMVGEWGKKFNLGYVYDILFTPTEELLFTGSGTILKLKVLQDNNPQDVIIEDFTIEKLIPDEFFRQSSGRKDTVWRISQFCLDPSGDIWAVSNNQVFQWQLKTQQLICHSALDYFIAGNAKKLISDLQGRVWFFSETHGIFCFNPNTEEVYDFTRADGIPSYDIIYGKTLARDPDGQIYVWTMEGIYFFDPNKLLFDDPTPLSIICSQFQVNHQRTFADSDSPFQLDPDYQPTINLNYQHKSFALRYSVIDQPGMPGDVRYQYKLEGFDEDWVSANSRTYLGYSNIPAGDYTLKINASLGNTFNEQNILSIPIYVATAPWLTWWAYLGYAMIIGAIFTTGISLYLNKEQKAQRLLLRDKEMEQAKKIEQAKTTFFTNVSHELRTPLTLILDPLRSLIRGEFAGSEGRIYQMMMDNANKLKVLVDQILDFSKIDNQQMKLNPERVELSSLTRQLLSNFNSLAFSHQITFDFHAPINPVFVWLDVDKYEKIVNNLLSNAFKFTPKGGNINVKIDNSEMISEASGYVNLIVEDTGIGIDSNETPHIFERFFQAYHAPSKGMSGTGIGLSLVRDFVKMHAGKTEVESQKGKGARFIVSFPLGKEHLSADHIVDTPGTGKKEEIKTTSPIVSATHLTSSDGKKPILLLVDDHPDMLQYISQRLRNHFEILTATDGEEALNLAKENIPDLIISDVMMPHMDGYELCEHIKTEPRTSHIPVILLTAKTDKGSKLHGLHKGADDYVDKPFDMDLLAGRALNLINQRQKLSEIFRKDLIISTDHKKLVSNDEKLLKSIIDIIEQHLDSTALNVEFLAREAGLSRTQLYRKIVGLTNQKPTEFIRTIRLKHAYQMLQADHGNVSEVAYAVGFNNLSYFSECFKKQYNMTPNESKKLAQS